MTNADLVAIMVGCATIIVIVIVIVAAWRAEHSERRALERDRMAHDTLNRGQ